MSGPPMLNFRYTCQRHQQRFIAILHGVGCCDPAVMDDVRRQMLAWLSRKYPRAVHDHFADETCLGCVLEADCADMEEVYRTVAELGRASPGR